MTNPSPFKKCPMCGQEWVTREQFLNDRDLRINGYTADFEELPYGLFYFTHEKIDCRSTLALYASDFFDLYTGRRYLDRRTGKDDCPGYCLDKNQLNRCDAICECAFVREIVHMINTRHEKLFQENIQPR